MLVHESKFEGIFYFIFNMHIGGYFGNLDANSKDYLDYLL